MTKNNLRKQVFQQRQADALVKASRRVSLGDFDYQMHPKQDAEAFARFDRVIGGPQFKTVQFDAGVRRCDN